MHILYVVHQFFPNHYTGTERLVLNLSKQMQRCGHHVTVLTYGITETEGFEERGKFLFKRYQYQGVPVVSVRHKVIPDLIDFTIIDDEMVSLFDAILAGEEIDVVHICHMMRVGSVIRFAKKREIPVLLTLTDFWLMCPRGIATNQSGALCDGSEDGGKCLRECYQGSYWTSLIGARFMQAKEALTYSSAVVSATRFLRSMFVNKGFRDDMIIIPFGKDYRNAQSNNRTYDSDSEITIGYLSSLNAHKGAHLLLEAYRQVNPSNIRLQIFGDTSSNPEYFETLKKIAGDNSKIEFCGRYDYESMPEILQKIDIIAVPSLWWENSPLVLLRALVHNVPAIVSDLGGLTEAITDGVNGFTFSVAPPSSSANDTRSLSTVIRIISENPSIVNELKAHILSPPRIEEEAFAYENLYYATLQRQSAPQYLQDPVMQGVDG
jgi:glycosyltransferase involved in cell wall biosynthesis